MPMHLNKPVADLTLLKSDGTPVHLRDYLGKPLLMIFLRHLA